MQLLVIYLPLGNAIFQTTPLSGLELAVCFILPSLVFAAVEVDKWLIRHGILYAGIKPDTRT